MELNSKNIKKILLIILFAVVTLTVFQNLSAVLGGALRVLSLFRPVIAGLCIAFVFNVILNPLENKVFAFMGRSHNKIVQKLRRPVCLILTYLIAFGIVITLLLVIIPDISETIVYLAEKLPSFAKQVSVVYQDILKRFNISNTFLPDIQINWHSVANTIKDYILNDSNRIFGGAVGITSSVVNGVFNTVFGIMISVYVLAQKEKIGNFMSRLISAFSNEKASKLIYRVSKQTYTSFSKFISGQLTESIILGSLCFIGMVIFRFPNAAVISVFICVTSLIPIIGATLGVIVGVLLILITSPIKALFFILFFIVLQQIEGTLIYPRVVGKSVGLPGVIVLSAVLVGGNIGGIIGALLSVPGSAVIYVLLKELIDYRINQKTAVKEAAVDHAENSEKE